MQLPNRVICNGKGLGIRGPVMKAQSVVFGKAVVLSESPAAPQSKRAYLEAVAAMTNQTRARLD
jgi:hypothetical protein